MSGRFGRRRNNKALRGPHDAHRPTVRISNMCREGRIMTNFLESTIGWAVPCLIATAIVAPVMWRKLRTRRLLEALHQAREHRDE
ncbi:hypothetical protein PSUB009319_05100 [Ralstonia sp. SET104]|nr:hypothetical protein PSUB009319_05100 [Ralstonia sp. SET104]